MTCPICVCVPYINLRPLPTHRCLMGACHNDDRLSLIANNALWWGLTHNRQATSNPRSNKWPSPCNCVNTRAQIRKPCPGTPPCCRRAVPVHYENCSLLNPDYLSTGSGSGRCAMCCDTPGAALSICVPKSIMNCEESICQAEYSCVLNNKGSGWGISKALSAVYNFNNISCLRAYAHTLIHMQSGTTCTTIHIL